jgi:RNA polymerase sigma factor (sigma-70 family)
MGDRSQRAEAAAFGAAPDLLGRLVEGEPGALGTVREWVEAVVLQRSWRLSDPEGAVQEVLRRLLVIGRERSFDGQSSLRTFVVSVARYTCIDARRRERFRSSFESAMPERYDAPGAASDPQRDVERRERLEHLRYIHQRMPEDCRKLWSLVYGEGLPSPEVARRLGITDVNARVRIHRCLEKARELGRQSASSAAAR